MTTEHGDGRDLGRSLKLLWDDRTRPPRGRPPSLTLERIVAAAVEVADGLALTEGLDALSMRSIATRLGVGTMTLYRYVPGKSELLDLMLDHVIGVPETDESDESDDRSWREILAEDARGHWRLCMKHPWYPFVDQSRPLLGPNSMRGLDHILGLLRPKGIADRTLLMMISAQNDFVESVARRYISEQRAERRTGVSNEEFWAAQEPTLVKALGSGDFPVMAALSDDTFAFSYEELFEFGLNRLHDGFEVHLADPRR